MSLEQFDTSAYQDSKQLSQKKRELAYAQLKQDEQH
jgi:ribonuclease HII